MGFETALIDAIGRINALLDKADAFPDHELACVNEASIIGCNALTDVVKNPDFRRTLDYIRKQQRDNTTGLRKNLEDLEAFEDFLRVEHKVLLKGGFNEYLAGQVIGWCSDVRQEVLESTRTPAEVIADAEKLRDQACALVGELKSKLREEEELAKSKGTLKKILKGAAGLALIGLNAAIGIAAGVTTAPVTAGASVLLAGAGVATSGALGAGIANNAASHDAATERRSASASG